MPGRVVSRGVSGRGRMTALKRAIATRGVYSRYYRSYRRRYVPRYRRYQRYGYRRRYFRRY